MRACLYIWKADNTNGVIMPLSVEVYHKGRIEGWAFVGMLPPGKSGSLSNNKPDGAHEIIVFECADDDSHSSIKKSKAGIDAADSAHREILSVDMELIKLLRRGESYEMKIKTDNGKKAELTRFMHI